MRNREGTILDVVDPSLDPGNIAMPMRKPKAPPICHCAPRVANRLGGMSPCIDLQEQVIRCRTCRKQIGPACRTRAVTHLRKLLTMAQTQPDHFNIEDCRAAGFLL